MKALVLACALVLTGCASGDPEPVRSPSSTPPTAEQQASLSDVVAARKNTEATSGELVETVTMGFGPLGALATKLEADFDGPAASTQATMTFKASSEQLEQMMTKGQVKMSDLRVQVLLIDDTVYMTMAGWPSKVRGRWLKFTEETMGEQLAAQGFAFPKGAATPSKLLPLIDVADEKVTSSAEPDGGATYQLTVPARDAVGALGNAAYRMLGQRNIDPASLTGTITFEVRVDGDNRVVGATLEATELMEQFFKKAGGADAPSGLTTTVELNITDFGKPVTVKAPPASKLIDPSEMN